MVLVPGFCLAHRGLEGINKMLETRQIFHYDMVFKMLEDYPAPKRGKKAKERMGNVWDIGSLFS
ncbi:MAG: hypothetical protein AMS15_00730 [Planctomycetes bacterium DG_23]|nr:MAG: hypothetical protein AMS15_00730 [Planctomycetes bacterium DG_23]